jgi:NAD(P)-dependent dehydrogenase (short-subunit alcohol dehydrogenase family)
MIHAASFVQNPHDSQSRDRISPQKHAEYIRNMPSTQELHMHISNSVALVTGANRGIGRQLVAALIRAGARKVYAAARNTADLAGTVALDPKRVVPLRLDVTDRAAVAGLRAAAPDVTLLINNAGVLDFGTALDVDIEAIERNLAVNLYGPLLVTRALAPAMIANGGGAVANILSVVALSSMPGLAGYNLSKAASHSATQSLRATLAPRGVSVHGVYPGPVDTDMAASIPLAKTSPADVADAVIRGIEENREDIFPDAMSASIADVWFRDPKAVERQFAAA